MREPTDPLERGWFVRTEEKRRQGTPREMLARGPPPPPHSKLAAIESVAAFFFAMSTKTCVAFPAFRTRNRAASRGPRRNLWTTFILNSSRRIRHDVCQ